MYSSVVKYIHIIVQQFSRTSSCKTGTLYPLNNNSPFPLPPFPSEHHSTTFYKVKVVQSCSTVCDPMDYTVHGILQARILEWVAFPFSRGSSQPRD